MMTREEMIDALRVLWMDESHSQTAIAYRIGVSRITINRFMGHPDRSFHSKTMLKIQRFIESIKKNETI